MKSLTFNFCHPVKGQANLIQLAVNTPIKHHFLIDSMGSNTLEVPVDNCGAGKWKIVLNWEYDGKVYSHNEEFEVRNSDYNKKEVVH